LIFATGDQTEHVVHSGWSRRGDDKVTWVSWRFLVWVGWLLVAKNGSHFFLFFEGLRFPVDSRHIKYTFSIFQPFKTKTTWKPKFQLRGGANIMAPTSSIKAATHYHPKIRGS